MPFQSCVDSDDYDFDKLSENIDWQPDLVAPVGYGEYSLWYLLNQHEAVPEDQTIFLGDDGLIHIKYMEEAIFTYEASEVLDFPDQTAYTFDLNLGVPAVGIPSASLPITAGPFIETFGMSTVNAGIILKEINLSSTLEFTLTNPLNTTVDLEVSLISGSQGGVPVTETYTIEANAVNQTEVLDLTDLFLTFNEPLSLANEIDIRFNATITPNGSTVTGSGPLGIQYQVGNVDLILAQGDFGDQMIDIGSGDIDLGVEFWEDIDGDFTFADPRIKLVLNNKVGVPFELTAEMTGQNAEGISQDLNLKAPLTLEDYPKTEAQVDAGVIGTMSIDNTNSDIVALMALPPSGNMTYSGNVKINPNNYDPLAAGNDINIISGTSSISADLEMDIPMDLKADNLTFSDTINEVDIDDADKIMQAKLIIGSENGLPLDVKIEEVYFTDANYTVLSTLSNESVIDAAPVNETTGEVDPAGIKKVINEIVLNQEQILSLNDTENIIIKAVASTYDEGNVSVKLKGSDKLKFSVAIGAKLDLSN